MKYIIFIFGETDNQDKFVNLVCDNIILNINVDYIKFFYGDTSCVYTFKSETPFDEVSKKVTEILKNINVSYFLLPYSDFEINARIDEATLEHLFGKDLDEEMPNSDDMDLVEPQTFFSRLDEALENLKEGIDDYDDEIDIEILPRLKKKKPIKTLDEILDQINENGLNSLTEEDKQLLEKYSNI
jgi:hypothetical protein